MTTCIGSTAPLAGLILLMGPMSTVKRRRCIISVPPRRIGTRLDYKLQTSLSLSSFFFAPKSRRQQHLSHLFLDNNNTSPLKCSFYQDCGVFALSSSSARLERKRNLESPWNLGQGKESEEEEEATQLLCRKFPLKGPRCAKEEEAVAVQLSRVAAALMTIFGT